MGRTISCVQAVLVKIYQHVTRHNNDMQIILFPTYIVNSTSFTWFTSAWGRASQELAALPLFQEDSLTAAEQYQLPSIPEIREKQVYVYELDKRRMYNY